MIEESWRDTLYFTAQDKPTRADIESRYRTLRSDIERKIKTMEDSLYGGKDALTVARTDWEELRKLANEYVDIELGERLDRIGGILKIVEMKEQIFQIEHARAMSIMEKYEKVVENPKQNKPIRSIFDIAGIKEEK